MGCSGSKEEHLPLVVRCRERQELIRAAANHRYALAAAHVSYFRSLKEVGDALRKFVDEELVTASSSSSSFSSPSLSLPQSSRKGHANGDGSPLHLEDNTTDDEEEESHLHMSDSSSEERDSEDHHHHHHNHRDSRGHVGVGGDDVHRHHDSNRAEERMRHWHNEGESAPSFPHNNGFSGYVNGFLNAPFANPYPYPYPYPMTNRGYSGSNSDRWDPHGMPPATQPWFFSSNSNVHYMKKSAPATKTVVQDPPMEPAYGYSGSYWNSPASYDNNYGYFPMGSPARMGLKEGVKGKSEREAPPPPSPKASAWDFFDPFSMLDIGYSGGGYGFGSNYSSPDSTEVREREGIPDLEEETETETYYKEINGKMSSEDNIPCYGVTRSSRSDPPYNADNGSRSLQMHKGDDISRSRPSTKSKGSSRSVSLHKIDTSSMSLPSWSSEESELPSMPPHNDGSSSKPSMAPRYGEESVKRAMADGVSLKDDKTSSESIVLKSVDEGSAKKKGVTFEVEEASKQDGDSSKLSSIALSSPRGTRDLREVVAEIRDEFETAFSYGKEVALMLEVGKLPYQPSFLKVFMSRMLYLISPSTAIWDSPSKQSAKLASSTAKLAKSFFQDVGDDVNLKASNLSSTLDKLYAWEKKLYKEVKDEERLRMMYEKQHKKLRTLDEEGAETRKIDAIRASNRRLLTKLDVSIKAIDTISSRIHKLRDEELQPQLTEIVHGLTRMWKAMLRCHQKQFQAVKESRMRRLKSNINQTDPASHATTDLERELRVWCERFNEWIHFQRSYVESLNEWLIRCLHYEPEDSPDGPVPYSPGRLGAPPIFVICNDWRQAMEAISEARVASAMNTFAGSLHQLWEKQNEEGRQRLKAEYLSKAMSDKTGLSVIASDNGVSALDDLKVDLDSMRRKLVQDMGSGSLRGGLVPIFKALESFSLEAVKAHEDVRVQTA